MVKNAKWLQGVPVRGSAVVPQGIEIESLAQFLAQFTAAELATCPQELLPTFGKWGLQWPDVCHCHATGGAKHTLHELTSSCLNANEEGDIDWQCACSGEAHIDGCPFDMCPIAQCHPLCYQVLGHGEDLYCHCPCHG